MVDRSDPVTWIGTGLLGIFGYRELLRNLVMRDLKLKYRGSILGFVWSLVNPLMMSSRSRCVAQMRNCVPRKDLAR